MHWGSNGITISNEIQVMAENLAQVDFTSTDFEADLATIISDLAGVDNPTPLLSSALMAQAHLEGRLPACHRGYLKVRSGNKITVHICYGFSMSDMIRSFLVTLPQG